MKKRILSCILTLAMVISLLPATTRPAQAAVGAISTTYNTIYADGNALLLQEGTTAGYTNVFIDINSDGNLDDGEIPIDLNEATFFSGSLIGNTSTGFNLAEVGILGGSKNNSITGDTKITMLGGTVPYIYGGGYDGVVNGNTNITMLGGTVVFIYGGGVGNGADACITGNTNLTLSGGNIEVVNGGGNDSYVNGSANVTINGATIGDSSSRNGRVYGGGSNTGGTVGSTNVTIRDGSTIYGNIYGGGQDGATTSTSTNIIIDGGILDTEYIYGGGYNSNVGTSGTGAECNLTINGGSFPYFGEIICGGGYSASEYNAIVYGSTKMIIKAGTINMVCGGGFAPMEGNVNVTGDTEIIVDGGDVWSLYGSGYANSGVGIVEGTASTTIDSGFIHDMKLGGNSTVSQAGNASATINGGNVGSIARRSVLGSAALTINGGNITGPVDIEFIKTVSFTNLTAVDGVSKTSATTQLTLTFDADPMTLTADNITVTGATKGTLSGTGTTRTLNISNITVADSENVTVAIADPVAYTITPASKTVEVYQQVTPTVSAITRQNPTVASTNVNSVIYRVAFSKSVTGVDVSDFSLTKTGTINANIASISVVSGTDIDVIVDNITGEGTLRLDVKNSGTGITDIIGNPIVGGYTGGQTYSVDRIAPVLTVVTASRISDTNATVKFTSDETGKYYYEIVASGTAQPTIDTSGTGIDCGTTENTITLATLNAGAKDIYIVVKDELENVSVGTFKINIPAYVAPSNHSGGSNYSGGSYYSGDSYNSEVSGSSEIKANTFVEILINGAVVKAGTKVDTVVKDKTITTVLLDEKMIEEKITAEGKKAVITIPISGSSSEVLIGELNGQIVKNMEDKQATLQVKTDTATYTIEALQINIDDISKQFGKDLKLSDIKVTVEITKLSMEANKIVENAADKGGFTIMASPVEFSVRCTYGKETIDICKFNNYVERTIQIPQGMEAAKITTGVVVDADGTMRSVPTKIVVINGTYYAKINSLTNSTYAVIWNPITYQDVANSPAMEAINDLGSRMVISGAKKGLFRPDSNITRAEFAAILVTSLGLTPGTGDTVYSDVKSKDWYCKYIEAAKEYGIISGDAKTKFRPKDKITTEEAMTMLTKAMKITELKVTLKKGEAKKLLASLAETGQSQVWADNNIAVCMKAGIVPVKSKQKIAPNDKITRAEAAVMIRNLLQKANLI